MWRGADRAPPPVEKRFLLVKELQGLPVAQRDHVLRGMPLGLAEKRSLRSVPVASRPASLAALGSGGGGQRPGHAAGGSREGLGPVPVQP